MQQENERIYSPKFYTDDELSGVSGVYQIRNITNGKLYVGSANNLWRRKNKEHFKFLRENRHENTYLQHAFNLNGEENFVFEVIEFCKEKDLLNVEQYWLDIFYDKQQMCYNINPIAGKPPSWEGKHHSEETKQKLREKNSQFRHSDETKQKLSTMAKERLKNPENHPLYNKHHTEESKQKMSNIRKEKFTNGELVAWNKGKTGVYTEETIQKFKDIWNERKQNGYIPWNKGKKCPQISNSNSPRHVKVIRLSDNKIYLTLKECIIENKITYTLLYNHCNGGLKTKPREYMYYEDWIKQQKDES